MKTAKTFEECQAIKAKQRRTGSLSVTYTDADEMLYRGYEIQRNDSVPNGYYGKFDARLNCRWVGTDSLRKAKQLIDNHIAAKTAATQNTGNQE